MSGFKVVMVGDICVGKTAIFVQCQRPGSYEPDLSQATLSATFAAIKYEVDDRGKATVVPSNRKSETIDPMKDNKRTIKLQLWDTAGDEKLKNLTKQYFQGAAAAVIVYDVTNRESLETAQSWIEDVRSNAPSDVMIYLAGNKIDLIEEVEVPRRDGQKLADEHNIPFYETSAKEGVGIQEMFGHMAGVLSKRKASRRETVRLGQDEQKTAKKDKEGCCTLF